MGDGRGEWCRDCSSLYRILYKGTMTTLNVFSRWLEHHRMEFFGNLVAYVTLKKEGVQHIASVATERRKQILEHAFQFCGYPFPAGAVQLLSVDGGHNDFMERAFMIPGAASSSQLFALVLRVSSGPPTDCTNRLVSAAQTTHCWSILPVMNCDSETAEWWANLGAHVCRPSLSANIGDDLDEHDVAKIEMAQPLEDVHPAELKYRLNWVDSRGQLSSS